MCNSTKIISLVGASGGGKSTLAKMLEERGYVRLAMAKPLKDALKAMGLTTQDLYGPPSHRSSPSDLLCGKSPRHAMMTLGTEWGRDLIGPDFWVNVVQQQIIKHKVRCAGKKDGQCKGVVIEDVRFPNEWAMTTRLGGQIWLIRRPEIERMPNWLDKLVMSRRPMVRSIGRALQPVAKLFGYKPVHESEYHWPFAPADAEIWNTGSVEDLQDQVDHFLARLEPVTHEGGSNAIS